MSNKSSDFQGIPMKDIQNPINEMYTRNQPEFGISLKELNNMKEGKQKAMTYEEKYKLHNQLMEYAKTFTTQVKHDLDISFDTNIIPIIFIDEPSNHFAGYDEKGEPHRIAGGVTLDYRKQSIMKIYDCANHSIDELEQTVRHECIHYMLWTLGLKHDDDTAAFHLLCDTYNAAAEQPMSTEEQKLYKKYHLIFEAGSRSTEVSEMVHANIAKELSRIPIRDILFHVGNKSNGTLDRQIGCQ